MSSICAGPPRGQRVAQVRPADAPPGNGASPPSAVVCMRCVFRTRARLYATLVLVMLARSRMYRLVRNCSPRLHATLRMYMWSMQSLVYCPHVRAFWQLQCTLACNAWHVHVGHAVCGVVAACARFFAIAVHACMQRLACTCGTCSALCSARVCTLGNFSARLHATLRMCKLDMQCVA